MIDYKPPVCKPKLREFSEYREDGRCLKVYVNPDDVMAVRAWAYHSFRPSIGEIILRHGEKLHVWETEEEIQRRLS